jgi:hypothetical protein
MTEEAATAKTASETPSAKPLMAREQLIEWTRTALPAIAGAIGVSGFVSILGAGVVWIRYTTAHLPADQAVGVLPASSLLVTGAVNLVVYLGLGLLAVAGVYLFQGKVLSRVLHDQPSPKSVKRLEAEKLVTDARLKELEGLITALTPKPPDPPKSPDAPDPAGAPAQQKGAGATPAGESPEIAAHLKKLEALRKAVATSDEVLGTELYDARLKVAEDHRVNRSGGEYGLLALLAAELILIILRTDVALPLKLGSILLLAVVGGLTVLYVYTKLERLSGHLRKIARAERAERFVYALPPLVALVLVVSVVNSASWILLPVLVSVVLFAGNLVVDRLHPRRFFWYGLSIFVSVALFGTVLTYSRSKHAPSAQPAALLLKDGCAVRGLWIGESSTREYLARVGVPSSAASGNRKDWGRVLWVERSDVVSESVGVLQSLDRAVEKSKLMATQLVSLEEEDGVATKLCAPPESAAVGSGTTAGGSGTTTPGKSNSAGAGTGKT